MKIKNRLIGLALPFCNASPNFKRKNKKWVGLPLILSIALYGAILGSCGAIKPLPAETATTVHVKDSTIFHIKDSIRITEATRYKDLAWLGDTLKIEGQRSRMWATADTTKEVILGGLEEDRVEEKTKVVYKTKWMVKDSIRVEEKPVPVEVIKEVKVYPKGLVILSILGIISILVLLFILYIKIKRKLSPIG